MLPINGWLNIYKPVGISSAGLVGRVKKILGRVKIGHTGTLDVEAEGVLPLAIGEATKLVQFLIEAKKSYRFKVQFGACTDTGDRAGKILRTTEHIPTKQETIDICEKFIGIISQIPPAFSALKISGRPAYKLARSGQEVNLKPRNIEIFNLKMESYDPDAKTAIYYAECSKGTYIRTLAEDISLSLQSLGFVLELARTRVGAFEAITALKPTALVELSAEAILQDLQKIEVVLADILVFDIDVDTALKVRHGKKIPIEHKDVERIWLRADSKILAIGSIRNGYFNSARVLNI